MCARPLLGPSGLPVRHCFYFSGSPRSVYFRRFVHRCLLCFSHALSVGFAYGESRQCTRVQMSLRGLSWGGDWVGWVGRCVVWCRLFLPILAWSSLRWRGGLEGYSWYLPLVIWGTSLLGFGWDRYSFGRSGRFYLFRRVQLSFGTGLGVDRSRWESF